MRGTLWSNRKVWMGVAVGAIVSVFWLADAARSGSLEPPGAPASTMKTLDEVEPRTPIRALPYTITTPGSYYLTRSLSGVSGNGITIDADNVTLDLMGFTLTGGAGTLSGITSSGNPKILTVRNGILRNWGAHGLFLTPVFSGIFEGLQAYDNHVYGIYVGGENNIIRNSVAEYSGNAGIYLATEGLTAGGGIVEGCSILNNAYGILVTRNSLVRNNQVYNSGSYGIRAYGTGNRIEANNLVGNGAPGVVLADNGNLLIRNSAHDNQPPNYYVGVANVVDGNYEY